MDDRAVRSMLAAAAERFVLPVYAEFVDKFGKLPFSSKNKDKYLIYSPQSLGQAIRNRFLGRS